MSDHSYRVLQEKYGGQFVALRNGEVVATGKTYGELLHAVERAALDRSQLIFEHVEPVDGLRAY